MIKRRLIEKLRNWGLLGLADRVNFYAHRLITRADNRRFRLTPSEFALPPPALLFETCGHVSLRTYNDDGRRHAAAVGRSIAGYAPEGHLSVLEWGCGTGRILRHLAASMPAGTDLTGVDVDQSAIRWCAKHINGIKFLRSPVSPPLAFAAQSFNVVYQYSVFTHLSTPQVEAWVVELARVLTADGLLITSTHGDHYLDMLTTAERAQYSDGHPVSKQNFAEGRKFFLSFHPPSYMRALLARHFDIVEHLPADAANGIPQDRWLARNPSA